MLIGSVCSDPALAQVLTVAKNFLGIIQIIIPIILVVAGSIEFISMMINPDDNKSFKKVFNSFLAAIIIFLLPVVVDLAMNAISVAGDVGVTNDGSTETFNIGACWTEAGQTADKMDSATDTKSSTIKDEEKKKRTTIPH